MHCRFVLLIPNRAAHLEANDAARVQTLRLEYASQQGDHTNLSIALDLDDVRQLSETCDRALRKAQASVDLIQGKCAIEAIIIGEKDK